MQVLEQGGIIVGAIVGVLGGKEAIGAGLRWWAAYRERRALARDQIDLARIHAEQSDEEREERTADRLWDRVERLEDRLDDCEERHHAAEKRGEECERRALELTEHVKALQEIALRNDDTGRFLIEKRSSPPAPLDLPPPKRREE